MPYPNPPHSISEKRCKRCISFRPQDWLSPPIRPADDKESFTAHSCNTPRGRPQLSHRCSKIDRTFSCAARNCWRERTGENAPMVFLQSSQPAVWRRMKKETLPLYRRECSHNTVAALMAAGVTTSGHFSGNGQSAASFAAVFPLKWLLLERLDRMLPDYGDARNQVWVISSSDGPPRASRRQCGRLRRGWAG
jgi:hypothetical protein